MPSKEPVRLGRPPPRGARKDQVVDLLGQALEAETGGAKVYEAAILSAHHEALRGFWAGSLARSRLRARALRRAFAQLDVQPDPATVGCDAVRRTQEFLAASIDGSRHSAPPASAQVIAAGCVVLAEARVDALWAVLRGVAKVLAGERGRALKAACEVAGGGPGTGPWARELWLQAIGLPATLPPQPLAAAAAPAKGVRPTSGWGTPPW